MSKSKALSSPPYVLLVSDDEVAISLGKLIDSVVMEVTAQRSALQPQQVNESNDGGAALGFDSLPDEIVAKIFSYLTQNQLGQIASVCSKWNMLTKSPFLWRKVNVIIFCSTDAERNAVVQFFINGLPSCVTSIRLDFPVHKYLNFKELCLNLHQNCPHVEELILARCTFSTILPEVINFCTQFLQSLKKLAFHDCMFLKNSRTVELNDNSKIEVLDLDCSNSPHFSKIQFSKLKYMKELHLHFTFRTIDDTWFVGDASFLNQLQVLDLGWTNITASTFLAIQRHGQNLEELYLCDLNLDHISNFNDLGFPHLKAICLLNYWRCEGLVALLQSCPSLQNVYVNEYVAQSFAAHPFVAANRSKAGIVKAIDLEHQHNVDYSSTVFSCV